MNKVLVLGLVVAGGLYLAWYQTSPARLQAVYAEHFSSPLPEGAEIVQYTQISSGFEPCHAFLFGVESAEVGDALCQQLVADWQVFHAQEEKTVLGLDPSWWWLDTEQLDAIPEEDKWGRVNFQEKRFWSVWRDAEQGYIYAEYGKY